jgi:hypothetical protein
MSYGTTVPSLSGMSGPSFPSPLRGHPRLPRARRERPRRCPAEQRDERAALHSITSSAATSSLSGTVRPNNLAV